jgi:hypothetical protein
VLGARVEIGSYRTSYLSWHEGCNPTCIRFDRLPPPPPPPLIICVCLCVSLYTILSMHILISPSWPALPPFLLLHCTALYRTTSLRGTQVYIKYWKPTGITTTTDQRVSGNVLSALGALPFQDRIFPVGRLDKPTTGLLLLTSASNPNPSPQPNLKRNNCNRDTNNRNRNPNSCPHPCPTPNPNPNPNPHAQDGPLVNNVLRPSVKKEKEYLVRTSPAPSDADLTALAAGVLISTAR